MIYRSIVVMLLVIQAQSHFLYGMGRELIVDKSIKEDKNKELQSLMMAANFSEDAAVKRLLDHIARLVEEGADVHTRDIPGMTPLHLAAKYGDLDVLKILIDQKADVNTRTWNARTAPLHLAAPCGNPEVLKMLISQKADVSQQDGVDKIPLHYAAEYGNNEAVQILIKRKSYVNATDKDGKTPLHYAAQKGNIEVVQALIDKGIKCDLTHEGADRFCIDLLVMSVMNNFKLDINQKDLEGMTPLHLAAASVNIEVVQLLIKAGADLNAIDNANQTPHAGVLLQLAEQSIAVQGSRLASIEDENQRIAVMQEIAHNPAETTERERLQVCAYMLEHPDQINSIFPIIAMKSARNR